MVKEITGDEENDRQDDDDSMSGRSSDIHNRLSLYHCDMHYRNFKFLLFDIFY